MLTLAPSIQVLASMEDQPQGVSACATGNRPGILQFGGRIALLGPTGDQQCHISMPIHISALVAYIKCTSNS